MIYSNLDKTWISTCMNCGEALINFESSANEFVMPRKYDYNILNKYFIMDVDWLKVRSNCGKCINETCKAYMKNQ